MRKLKIVYISSCTNDFIVPYVAYFQKRGHDVYLLSCDRRDIGISFLCPVFDISFGAHGRNKNSKWRYLLGAVKAGIILRKLKPDILHGHYITSSGVIAWVSGFRPYLLTAHGSDVIKALESRLWRFVLPRVLEKAALVNPVSEGLAGHLVTLGIPSKKIFTATLGVDTDYFAFRPRRSEGNPWRLLCIRQLKEVYDPHTIINACAILKARGLDFEMTFAAGGPMQKDLERAAQQMNIDEQVKFLGGYNNANLPQILYSHDLYISASLWDGTSISLLEAMAAGIFPVVSRISANTALLEDGTTSVMFNCGDAKDLADAICMAIDKSELRAMAVRKNREVVVQKADRYSNMQKLEMKYYDILDIAETKCLH